MCLKRINYGNLPGIQNLAGFSSLTVISILILNWNIYVFENNNSLG